MNRQWVCTEIECDANVQDDLAAEVAEAFNVSVEFIDKGIRFYLEGSALSDAHEEELQRIFQYIKASHSLDSDPVCRTSLLFDDDWADRWKDHFKPLRVGRHFLVCPSWEECNPGPDDRVISMDPGRAFGTGHHETTRLCLEWLEDCFGALQASGRLQGQASLLDVGTGSGILCMAAALLGFQPVLGIDNDPEAIEVAVENLELNRLSSRVELREATVGEISGRYAVVIANIQSIPLVEMAPDMVRCLAPSGKLGLSGILLEQQDEVRTAYESLGLRCVETRTAGEWCLLAFES